jgi:hypothetical protein
MASTVVTAARPTLSMVVMQERVDVPSRRTVHTPQKRHPAAELRDGHAGHVTKHPQHRGVAVDIGGAVYPIGFDRKGRGRLLYVNSLQR